MFVDMLAQSFEQDEQIDIEVAKHGQDATGFPGESVDVLLIALDNTEESERQIQLFLKHHACAKVIGIRSDATSARVSQLALYVEEQEELSTDKLRELIVRPSTWCNVYSQ